MTDELKYVLEKMCTYVNLDINDIDIEKEGWYNDHEWEEEDEEHFYHWLTDEFRTNNKVRKQLTQLPSRPSIVRAQDAARWFIFYCGWKTKRK